MSYVSRADLEKHLMDLGIGDVHVDSGVKVQEPRMTYEFNDKFECAEDCKTEMSRLAAAKDRNEVSEEDFQSFKAKIEEASKKFSVHVPTAAVITPEMSFRGEVIELSDKDHEQNESRQIWIQVAKQGKFRGHAAGPFEMNVKTFEEIIRNFKASQNKAIPVDFEHASEQDPTEGTIPVHGAPAQGWVVDLKIGNDGNLWGLVEWLPLAREYIRNRQYKFLSPAIVFGAKDRVTGKPIGARLSSVALTNNPFLDGMAPLAAKHRESAASNGPTQISLADSVIVDALLKSLNNKNGGASSGDRPTTEESPMTDVNKQVTDLSTQLAETKLTLSDRETKLTEAEKKVSLAETKLAESESKVAELTLSLKEEAAKLTAATEELTTLRAWKEQEEQRRFDERLTEAFDTYKDARKLTDADKEMMSVFLKANPAKFDERFPKVPADKRHLMRTLAGNGKEKDIAPTTVPAGEIETHTTVAIDPADAAIELSRQRGIPLDAAQRIVFGKLNKAAKTA